MRSLQDARKLLQNIGPNEDFTDIYRAQRSIFVFSARPL